MHVSLFHMFVAGVFFALMSVCVKGLSGLHVSQIVFFRGVIAMSICLVQLRVLKVNPWGKSKKLLLMRGVFGTIALVCFFTTLQYMPMSTAVSLQYLAPIFLTLLSVLFLKEKVYSIQWLCLLVAFMGTIALKGLSSDLESWVVGLGIFSALCSASAYLCIRKIRNSEHPLVVIFYFPLITIPLIAPFAFYYWKNPSLLEWGLLLFVGIFVQTAQYFMTMAYQSGEASRVSILSYLGLLYGVAADIWIFSSLPSRGALVGMVGILFGVMSNTLFAHFLDRKQKRSQALLHPSKKLA